MSSYDPMLDPIRKRVMAKVTTTEDGHWLWNGAGAASRVQRYARSVEGPLKIRTAKPQPHLKLRDGTMVHPATVLHCETFEDLTTLKPRPTCGHPTCCNPEHFHFSARHRTVYTHDSYGVVELVHHHEDKAWIRYAGRFDEVVMWDELKRAKAPSQ